MAHEIPSEIIQKEKHIENATSKRVQKSMDSPGYVNGSEGE